MSHTGPCGEPFSEYKVSQRHLVIPDTAYMTRDGHLPIKEKAYLCVRKQAASHRSSLEPRRAATRARSGHSGHREPSVQQS